MSAKGRPRAAALILVLLWLVIMSVGVTRAQQSNFVAPVLIVNTGNLNIRTGPGVNYPVLLVATGGSQFPVLGVARDLVWYQINTDAGVGWVNVEFTVARGDFTNVPFADAPAVVNTSTTANTTVATAPRQTIDGNRVIINTGNLNVRSGPGSSYPIIAKVSGGVELAIVGRAGDDEWFLIEGIFGLGWVDSEYVIFRGDFNTVPIIENAYQGGGVVITTTNTVTNTNQTVLATAIPVPVVAQDIGNVVIVNTGSLNVRSGPGSSYTILAKVSGGVQLSILGRAPDDEWFLVEGVFGLGWLDSEYVIFRGDYNIVPIIEDAYKGGGLIINAVNPVTNTTQSTVATPQPAPVVPVVNEGNRVIINTGNLNVRSGPGAGFSVVAVVSGGTELAVLGRAADGVWYLVEGSFGQGWLNIEFVIFRGNGASVPILDIRG